MIILEGAESGFWACLSLARQHLLNWHGTTEGIQLNIRLVDLPVKSPVRVDLLEGILNAWVSALGPEDFFTLQEASEVMSSPHLTLPVILGQASL